MDPQLAARVLARVCLPDVVEAPAARPDTGVKAFARRPPWFGGRGRGSDGSGAAS